MPLIWEQIKKQGNWVGPGNSWDWSTSWDAAKPLDPYLVWADITDRIDYDKPKKGGPKRALIPVMIEFDLASSVAQGIVKIEGTNANNAKGIVAPVYKNASTGNWKLLNKTRFITAQVRPKFFKELGASNGVFGTIKRVELVLPVDTANSALILAETLPIASGDPSIFCVIASFFNRLWRNFWASRAEKQAEPAPPGVADNPATRAENPPRTNTAASVIGIIDDGLAFANANVRDRIKYYWDQETDRRDATSPPPANLFDYGRELGPYEPAQPSTYSSMNKWISAATVDGMIDEEAVYASAKIPQLQRRVTHGAAVASIATAGQSTASVVCVQLPATTTMDTSGASLGAFVLDGLHYILYRADQVTASTNSPVVVNLSYGDMAGPHDGTSMLESAIDDLVTACGALPAPVKLSVVIPAGNSMQARCHAQFSLAADMPQTLAWRIHPDDMTPSFMEVWLPTGNVGSTIEVKLTPPGGAPHTSPAKPNEHYCYRNSTGRTEPVCAIIFPKFPAGSNGDRRMVLIAVAPTASLEKRALAPAGVWKVEVKSTTAVSGIDAWIQRDDSPFGYPRRGRQSYFDDPNYVRFTQKGIAWETDANPTDPFEGDATLTYVKRAATLNAIATGTQALVVGAYRSGDVAQDGTKEDAPARYSSSGPVVRNSNPGGPLLSQVAEDSRFHHGVLAGGTHSGSTTAFNGTSIAAPQVANEVLAILTAGGTPAIVQTSGAPNRVEIVGSSGAAPSFMVGPVEVHTTASSADRIGLGYDKLPGRTGRPARRENT